MISKHIKPKKINQTLNSCSSQCMQEHMAWRLREDRIIATGNVLVSFFHLNLMASGHYMFPWQNVFWVVWLRIKVHFSSSKINGMIHPKERNKRKGLLPTLKNHSRNGTTVYTIQVFVVRLLLFVGKYISLSYVV